MIYCIFHCCLFLVSSTSQKSKTAHKLKAQTSKIVSSFKAPQFNCAVLKEFVGHKDGIWEVSVARLGIPAIGTASAGNTLSTIVDCYE